MCWFWWGHQHGIVTNPHYPTRARLAKTSNITVNWLVHDIIPVLDRKPIGRDYDDEHHSRLIDRQHKNNNDASPIFVSVPIGSAIGVQWEDSGLWTHGTIVGTGDPQPPWPIIHSTTHNKWQKDLTKQMTYQANISNSRCLHTIPSHKTYKQTKQPHWMLY